MLPPPPLVFRLAAAIALLAGAAPCQGQDFDLPLSPRIDTTRADIGAVYRLWRGYLNARPDSVRTNPYWSEAEQARYGDFDLSRRWTYGYVTGGFSIHKGLGIKPRLLSIEPEGDAYAIRTLYAPDDLSDFQGLYSVQRVYALRENGVWRLSNALPLLTREWVCRRVGLIKYFHPAEHAFDEAAAQRAAAFADSVAATFGPAVNRPIEYYLAPSAGEMARIIGLDYSWDSNDGRAYPENRQVFVGTGQEDYLHEIVHALFGPLDVAPIVSEGLATYLGGFGGRSFEQLAADTARQLQAVPEVTLDGVLRGAASDVQTFYVTGAVLVGAVLELGGPNALQRFLGLARTPEGVYDGLREVLGVRPEGAQAFWRQRMLTLAGA